MNPLLMTILLVVSALKTPLMARDRVLMRLDATLVVCVDG